MSEVSRQKKKRQSYSLQEKYKLLSEYASTPRGKRTEWVNFLKTLGYPALSAQLLTSWLKQALKIKQSLDAMTSKRVKRHIVGASRKSGMCMPFEERIYERFVDMRAVGASISYSILRTTAAVIRTENKQTRWYSQVLLFTNL